MVMLGWIWRKLAIRPFVLSTIMMSSVLSPCAMLLADDTPKKQLRLGSAFREPYIIPPEGGSVWQRLTRIEQQVGVDFVFVDLPAARSIVSANRGVIDGDLLRTNMVSATMPNLVRVPYALVTIEAAAFTWMPDLKVCNFQELSGIKDVVVSTQIGRKYSQNKLRNYKNRLFVETAEQLFNILEQQRSDIAVLDRPSAYRAIGDRLGKTIFETCETPLITQHLYMFLHKKHEGLVSKIATALTKDGQMKPMP